MLFSQVYKIIKSVQIDGIALARRRSLAIFSGISSAVGSGRAGNLSPFGIIDEYRRHSKQWRLLFSDNHFSNAESRIANRQKSHARRRFPSSTRKSVHPSRWAFAAFVSALARYFGLRLIRSRYARQKSRRTAANRLS